LDSEDSDHEDLDSNSCIGPDYNTAFLSLKCTVFEIFDFKMP